MENIGREIESIHVTMDRETYSKIRSRAHALALPISAFVRMTMVEALRADFDGPRSTSDATSQEAPHDEPPR